MRRLLARRTTAFVLVTSPRPDAVKEAGWFADKLNESGLAVEGLVVNRVHPSFGPSGASRSAGTRSLPRAPADSALARMVDNLQDHRAINAREEETVSAIVTEVAPSPVARVPLLDIDVHDVAGLGVVADHIFGREPKPVVAPERSGLA